MLIVTLLPSALPSALLLALLAALLLDAGAQVMERAAKRGQVTGRVVPEQTLRESIEKTKQSLQILGPQADFLAVQCPWLLLMMMMMMMAALCIRRVI